MLELAATQLQQIQQLLAQRRPHVCAVELGSRIKGWPAEHRSKPYSDLDIALWGVQSDDEIALAHLRADLEESHLPWRVDLSLVQGLPVSVRQDIERHGIAIHGRTESRRS